MGYIVIEIEMKDRATKYIVKGKAICKDGLCLTTFSNPKQTEITFKKMKQDGKKVNLQDGVIIEKKEGESATQIADALEKDIKKLAKKFKKMMRVVYKRREVK